MIINKKIILSLFCLSTTTVFATGMAVGIPNLYLSNNTQEAKSIVLNNDKNLTFVVFPKSACKLDVSSSDLMFLPTQSSVGVADSYAITLSGEVQNKIVLNKKTGIALENTKKESLLGFCGDRISKIDKYELNSSGDSLPTYNLKYCSKDTSVIYSIQNIGKEDLSLTNGLTKLPNCTKSK